MTHPRRARLDSHGFVRGRVERRRKTHQETNMQITITTGSEGPRHDPYGFDEITVTRASGDVAMLHDGLVQFAEINGERVDDDAKAAFERVAGIEFKHVMRAYRRLRSRCRECGCRETRSVDGFPGESFEECVECGAIVDSHFDINAII